MIGNKKIWYQSEEHLISEFNRYQKENIKLEAVKNFYMLNSIGLKESKEWIDENWSDNLGEKVLSFYNNKEYVTNSFVATNDGKLNLNIKINKNITESGIDELIEQLSIQIIEFVKS
jgi:hypothetical protein